MFETFDVPGFYLANQATLAVIASGKTTGLVVGCGHSSTCAIPVFEGSAIPHSTQKNEFAGEQLSNFMKHLVNDYNLTNSRAD